MKGLGRALGMDTMTDFEVVLHISPLTSIQSQAIAQIRSPHLEAMAETTFHQRT